MVEKKSATIEDSGLLNSLVFMKQKGLLRDNAYSLSFDSVREAEESAREDIVASVVEQLNNLKADISFLQKKGENFHLESISLLEIPLKLRVWKASPSVKELEKILGIIQKASIPVRELKSWYDKKELEERGK